MVKAKYGRMNSTGRVRFIGTEIRALLHDVDGLPIIQEIARKRMNTEQYKGDCSVCREIEGHTVKFTQKQMRSLLLHVEEVIPESS